MRSAILIIFLITMAFVGEWGYRMFLRPVDPVQPCVQSLAEHFNKSGIPVEVRPVRHSFRHSYVIASAELRIKDFPLTILVDVCPSDQIAEEHLQSIRSSPNLPHSLRRGRLVMYLPMWANEEPMAEIVKKDFASFKPQS